MHVAHKHMETKYLQFTNTLNLKKRGEIKYEGMDLAKKKISYRKQLALSILQFKTLSGDCLHSRDFFFSFLEILFH